MMRSVAVAFLLAVGAMRSAAAQVTVEQPWVRATAPGQTVAAAYLKIRSAHAAALVGVRTPVASEADIHEMAMEGAVMKMRSIARLELPPGKTVELKPGGYHLMLVNVTRPLRPGDTVPLTLIIEESDGKREQVSVRAQVRPLTATGEGEGALGDRRSGHGGMH